MIKLWAFRLYFQHYLASSHLSPPSLSLSVSLILLPAPQPQGQHTLGGVMRTGWESEPVGELTTALEKNNGPQFQETHRLDLQLFYCSMNYYKLLKILKKQVLTDFLLGWLLSYPVVTSRICNIANVPQNFGYSFGESKLRSLSNILLMVVGS